MKNSKNIIIALLVGVICAAVTYSCTDGNGKNDAQLHTLVTWDSLQINGHLYYIIRPDDESTLSVVHAADCPKH